MNKLLSRESKNTTQNELLRCFSSMICSSKRLHLRRMEALLTVIESQRKILGRTDATTACRLTSTIPLDTILYHLTHKVSFQQAAASSPSQQVPQMGCPVQPHRPCRSEASSPRVGRCSHEASESENVSMIANLGGGPGLTVPILWSKSSAFFLMSSGSANEAGVKQASEYALSVVDTS